MAVVQFEIAFLLLFKRQLQIKSTLALKSALFVVALENRVYTMQSLKAGLEDSFQQEDSQSAINHGSSSAITSSKLQT
jgi:hypothetical protein